MGQVPGSWMEADEDFHVGRVELETLCSGGGVGGGSGHLRQVWKAPGGRPCPSFPFLPFWMRVTGQGVGIQHRPVRVQPGPA